MARIIEARAVISAQDKTGAVFDSIAKKINGAARAATAFAGVKPPQAAGKGLIGLGQQGWGQSFQKQIDAMALSTRQLSRVQKDWENFHAALAKGPVRFASYTRALDDWKTSTLSNLQQVSAKMQAHERRRQRFFSGVNSGITKAGGGLRTGAEMALAAGGVGGALFVGAEAIRGGVKASADRAREFARYNLGGLTSDEREEALSKADEISRKYPSIGRTEALAHIRQLRSRLGDFHHAIDNVETLAKAQVVLGTLGHGGEEADGDLEKLVLGLESQGLGNNPEKFKQYLNAFVRAKSLFPDLRGEDFRQFMKNANASKYGLSDDYLQNVVPTMMQHEGANNFGVSQASAFSALIGGRQTKEAKAKMASYGLTEDAAGKNIKKADLLISNPYRWATEFLAPQLESKGVRMDEEHRGDVVKAITQMFSNRKVGEFFTSMLVNHGIIEKDRDLLKGAKGTEGADTLRTQDPYIALAGVTNQLKDFAAAVISLKPAISAMNEIATTLSEKTKAVQEGRYLDLLPEDDRRIINGARKAWNESVDDVNERNRRGTMQAQIRELDAKLANPRSGLFGYTDADRRNFRLKKFDLQSGVEASERWQDATSGGLFSDKEIADWQEMDREHRRGVAYATMGRPSSIPDIPLPVADPRKTAGEMPPVQSLEGATIQAQLTGSGDVKGEMTITNIVQAGSELLRVVEQVRTLSAGLTGHFNASGPGSTGKSSPDAAAPAIGGVGGGGL